MQVRSLCDHFGVVLSPDGDGNEALPSPQEFLALLKTHGIVQARGFAATPEDFFAYGDRITLGQRRGVFGSADLHFHGEGYYLPFWRIDVLWFYCAVAPLSGGETKVCDGTRVVQALRPSTVEYFKNNKLVYENWLQRAAWMGLLKFMGYLPHSVETAEQAASWFRKLGLSCEVSSPDTVRAIYRCDAIMKTQWGDEDAFVNTMVHALIADQKVYRLVNDFPEDIVAEVREVTDRSTVLIPWGLGDFAAIDNTRFMHGRRAYVGPRKLVAVNGHFVNGWSLPFRPESMLAAEASRA